MHRYYSHVPVQGNARETNSSVIQWNDLRLSSLRYLGFKFVFLVLYNVLKIHLYFLGNVLKQLPGSIAEVRCKHIDKSYTRKLRFMCIPFADKPIFVHCTLVKFGRSFFRTQV